MDVLAASRELVPAIAARAAEIEHGRRLPLDLVKVMTEAGIFRLCLPVALGGLEVHPLTIVEVLETLAWADGSAGWAAMIGSVTGSLGAYLDDDGAAEVFADPFTITGGVFGPFGRAEPDGNGAWRATGRWPFASGSEHCRWLLGGCTTPDGGFLGLLFDAADVQIIDTWSVSGLRGTGSHDMAVAGALVPARRTLPLLALEARRGGPLYRFPFFGLLALGIGAVGLGIARRALDELVAMLGAPRKPPRSVLQAQVAQAEGALRAARAALLHEVTGAWSLAESGTAVPLRARATLRLAITDAARTAADVTRAAYDMGGARSLFDANPLQRCFRDAHAVTQHQMVAPPTYELIGRVLLGLDADTSTL